MYNVCMISSNFDPLISKIVSETIEKVGINGVVNIVESSTGETKSQLVSGLIFDRGLAS